MYMYIYIYVYIYIYTHTHHWTKNTPARPHARRHARTHARRTYELHDSALQYITLHLIIHLHPYKLAFMHFVLYQAVH